MFRYTSQRFTRSSSSWNNFKLYSTSTRTKPTFRTLLGTPIFKSIFLTLVFGSTVIDLMKSRKDLASLIDIHNSKFTILEEMITKLENGENINIQEDLKIANALTKHKYNTASDINMDEELEKFLKLADDEEEKVKSETPVEENIKLTGKISNKFI